MDIRADITVALDLVKQLEISSSPSALAELRDEIDMMAEDLLLLEEQASAQYMKVKLWHAIVRVDEDGMADLLCGGRRKLPDNRFMLAEHSPQFSECIKCSEKAERLGSHISKWTGRTTWNGRVAAKRSQTEE